jgi:hypothetical protein
MKTLDDFAPESVKKPRKAKPEWAPPTLADLAPGRVLTFDPSLSATGFVDMEMQDGVLTIHEARTLVGRYNQDLTGWEKDFAAAEDLYNQFLTLMSDYIQIIGLYDLFVVNEAPPMGGGQLASPESAVQAGLALRLAARQMAFPLRPMIAPQVHKRATAGNGALKKSVHHAALKPLLETLSPGALRLITNESQRDAASVGLADMIRRNA